MARNRAERERLAAEPTAAPPADLEEARKALRSREAS